MRLVLLTHALALPHRLFVTGLMKGFLCTARERLEAVMITPSSTTSDYNRGGTLVLLTLAGDVSVAAWLSRESLSVVQLLVFGFDLAEIAVIGLKTLGTYGA